MRHSFGLCVLEDGAALAAEIERVTGDIGFIRTALQIGLADLVRIARSCDDDKAMIEQLCTRYGCTDSIAQLIADSELTDLETDRLEPLLSKLLKYHDFLSEIVDSQKADGTIV